MDESKDREGSRGLMRGGSMANRSSPATRQQPLGSSSPTGTLYAFPLEFPGLPSVPNQTYLGRDLAVIV